MTVRKRRTEMAQRAAACVREARGSEEAEYLTFAQRFPVLVHACGLAQAVSYAQEKAPAKYLQDLVTTLNDPSMPDKEKLGETARRAKMADYHRLAYIVIAAATWLKRYAEAFIQKPE